MLDTVKFALAVPKTCSPSFVVPLKVPEVNECVAAELLVTSILKLQELSAPTRASDNEKLLSFADPSV